MDRRITPSLFLAARRPPSPWLRWPLAIGSASLCTLLMLAALATRHAFQPTHRTPLQTASLQTHLPNVPATKPASQPPHAKPEAPPPDKSPAPGLATKPLAPIATPAVQAAATSQTPGAAEATTSAETLPRSPTSPETRAGGSARSQDQPLAQRCPEQIKPGFPERAREDDIVEGRVSARLYLDATGRVTEVEILSAEPPGYFEREVRRAALRWRCQGSGQADSLKVPFRFEQPGH